MSEHDFVNRRGHRALVNQDDVVLKIDDEPVKTEANTQEFVPKTMRPRKQWRVSRLQRNIIAIILLVLVATPVLVGEYVRATYGASVDHALNETKKLTPSVIAGQKNTRLKSPDIANTVTQLNSLSGDMCHGEFLDNLAGLYPRATESLKACADTKNKLTALSGALSEVTSQLLYLEQLDGVMTTVVAQPDEKFAVIPAQRENWQTFAENLKKLSPPTSFRAAHGDIVKKTDAIVSRWTALSSAFSAQDSAAFDDAKAKLDEAYAAFRSSVDGLGQAVDQAQVKLTDARSQLNPQ